MANTVVLWRFNFATQTFIKGGALRGTHIFGRCFTMVAPSTKASVFFKQQRE